ncbi:MAG: lysophospholipid acyltransferase family protein [Ignavibacteria bacterium]|nr:lysophospholipid acyltransferase family protein [Ignavibacteria bacterium]MCU7503101.1 lysophospholipid acyltransferase family protein [Ignavibacteria bacterium]MCU7516479.1 lysophospholipid acyltransferase family protein [Ignavibacteria bacterium]
MKLKNGFEYFLFTSLVRVFSLIGIKRARHAAHILAFLFYYVIPIRKSTVISNLKLAFPEKSAEEIKRLSYRTYYSFAVTIVEIMCIPYQKLETLKSLVKCPDLELIRKKYEENKGAILLTAHFGNWELAAISVAAQLGITMYVAAKPQRNSLVGDWLNMMREKFGNKVVMLGMSFRNIFKELKNRHIIGLVGDQRGEPDGPRVNFMGVSSAVYPGTAVLAIRTGAPVIVCIVPRQPDFSYTAHVDIIETSELEGTEEEKILEINQRYSSILEKYIRMYPEQWLWMHKRWKY